MTSTYALLSMSVSPNQQGIVFGLGQSANSLGGGIGPTIGGAIGSALSFKSVVLDSPQGMYLLTSVARY